MDMESEDETSESESEDEELHRRLGRSNAFIAYESSEKSLEADNDDNASSDDEPITSYLMAKTSKDQVSAKHQKIMNGYSPEYIAYAKHAKIANLSKMSLKCLRRILGKPKDYWSKRWRRIKS